MSIFQFNRIEPLKFAYFENYFCTWFDIKFWMDTKMCVTIQYYKTELTSDGTYTEYKNKLKFIITLLVLLSFKQDFFPLFCFTTFFMISNQDYNQNNIFFRSITHNNNIMYIME